MNCVWGRPRGRQAARRGPNKLTAGEERWKAFIVVVVGHKKGIVSINRFNGAIDLMTLSLVHHVADDN